MSIVRVKNINNFSLSVALVALFFACYGRLVRENNSLLDKTFIYKYNNIGNITGVEEYAYSEGDLPESATKEISYIYNTTHPDRLTNFNGKAITYNSMGCVSSYDGCNYSWSRGKLSTISKNISNVSRAVVNPSKPALNPRKTYSFTYNSFGQRVGMDYSYFIPSPSLTPVSGGECTAYNKVFTYDQSGRLISETNSKSLYGGESTFERIVFLYDESSVIGMEYTAYNTTNTYYYLRNLQGDVTAIYDTNGNLKVKYAYDAYGNCTIASGTTDYVLARVNPIRYRGYYYDQDTGLYYLNARYYSPEWRRFISPDSTEYIDYENPNGLNLYAYAGNNPVSLAYSSSGKAIGRMTISAAYSFADDTHYNSLNSLSIKFPSQNWVSLGIGFSASMAGALSVLGWTTKNPEFYEFWYTAYGITKYEMLSNLKSPMTRFASVVSYGLAAYDIYTDFMGHINAGDSWQKATASGLVTAGVGALNIWASAKVGAVVGAKVGSIIGGVSGFLIGTASGVVVGVIINGIFYTEINDKSIAGYIEYGMEWFLELLS